MSIDLIKAEIRRFLTAIEPEVLVITGGWGVGKSYTWNEELQSAVAKKSVSPMRYSAVSVFGLSDLKDLRAKIIANSRDPSNDSLPKRSAYYDILKGGIADASKLKHLKALGQVSNAIDSLFYMTLEPHIICIDDIERAGKQLDTVDLLGFVSELKEKKKCKVVLLMNHDALLRREDFERHLDKVADKIVVFRLFSKEALDILDQEGAKISEDFEAATLLLRMNNIRVLRKAARFVDQVIKLLEGYNARIISQAIRDTVLCTYCRFEPDNAPPIDFMANRIRPPATDPLEAQKEEIWREQLQHFDRLDNVGQIILEGVLNGFFDGEILQEYAEKKQAEILLKDRAEKFRAAWEIFHRSFSSDDEDEFVAALLESFKSDSELLSLRDLDSSYEVLKKINRTKEADQILKDFSSENSTKPVSFWESQTSHFRDMIRQEPVIEMANQMIKSATHEFDAAQTLIKIGNNRGWDVKDIEYLTALSEHDFYNILKSYSDNDLEDILRGTKMIVQSQGQGDDLRPRYIAERVAKAVADIAQESPLNRIRMEFRYPAVVKPQTEVQVQPTQSLTTD